MPEIKSIKTDYETIKQKTAHYDEYKVNKSTDVIFMSVYPGDTGQAALTEVFIEGNKIIEKHPGAIEDYELGTNKSLRGRFIDVYTLVTDVQQGSNLTSFLFELFGGVKPYEYYTEKTVQTNGDSVIYKITIFFTIH
jgi:hypothetical protein